ncbi:MAG: homocysteine S-methyltransferase family protein [Cellulosilyticaceae bacterium]
MNTTEFRELLKDKVLLFDGATGTELQKRGMPNGCCPEQWILQNPHILQSIQKEYIESGSNFILAPTFGCNRIKLAEFGLQNQVEEMNIELVKLSKQVANNDVFVAGDLSPTGRFLKPLGDTSFEEAVDVYKEQVNALTKAGVDLIFIETMIDLQEARAALLAVKESCCLPVIVSMTYEKNGRTLTGTDPVTALITLQELGADGVGVNCSTGPDEMIEIVQAMKPYAKVPLMAKPNAGIPKFIDGHTVFELSAKDFAKFAPDFVESGVHLFGGCCGTTAEHLRQSHDMLQGIKPSDIRPIPYHAITSSRKSVFFGPNMPTTIVGERINPTGKKQLSAMIKEGDYDFIQDLATEQEKDGAKILDVNVGVPGINEKQTMVEIIELLSMYSSLPLCIDSSSPEVIEAALRVYPGRALINSISAEEAKMEALLKIAGKYGAMFILLPLSDKGVPKTCEERRAIVQSILKAGEKHGVTTENAIVDGLVMTVSANPRLAKETLNLVKWCSDTLKVCTVIGLSNVSFGLPERKFINSAFLAMAIQSGLTMAIANPSADLLYDIKLASDVLMGLDSGSKDYIARHVDKAQKQPFYEAHTNEISAKGVACNIEEQLRMSILSGEKDKIIKYLEQAIEQGKKATHLIDGVLIPAITTVGQNYELGIFFLPQLIQSAETMQNAFEYLQPYLIADAGADATKKVTIVIATVKGDIHDIGKNIVALMLKNYGFVVYDLGKDVSCENIIEAAITYKADIIALSALMTTTMVQMKNVIKLAKEKNVTAKIMVGGAVVDQNYATLIGADGYSKDAYEAVKLANTLAKKHLL